MATYNDATDRERRGEAQRMALNDLHRALKTRSGLPAIQAYAAALQALALDDINDNLTSIALGHEEALKDSAAMITHGLEVVAQATRS